MDLEDRLEMIALLARDSSWKALVRIGQHILDEVYPETVFPSENPNPAKPRSTGSAYIVALREALAKVQEDVK